MSDARITLMWRHLFASTAALPHQQPAADYERKLARYEHPFDVPSRADVLGRVDEALAARNHLDVVVAGIQIAAHPDPFGGDRGAELAAVLEDAWHCHERAAHHLLVALVAGGRPPRRWALRRWTRRLDRLRWWLCEGNPMCRYARRDGHRDGRNGDDSPF